MTSSPSSSFQRQQRVRLERKVSLKFKDLQGFSTEISENVSMGGMFLRTDSPQPPGTLFDFELTLEEAGPLIQGIAEVVWVREEGEAPGRPGGMGVRFLELAPGSRALIYQMVDQHITRGGQPFELTDSPPPVAVETAWAPELPPEPRAIRAGSYAVLASPQRKKDEEPAFRAPWRPSRRARNASRRLRWAAVAAVVAITMAAVWYWSAGKPEIAEPEPSGVEGAGERVPRDPLAAVVPTAEPMETAAEGPEGEPEAAATEVSGDPAAGDGTTTSSPPEPPLARPETIEPEPMPPEPAEAIRATAPSPAPRTAPPPSTATALRDITWQRRGDSLAVTLLADAPFADGWSHFRMDQGSPREVVRLVGIREPFRTALPVGEPELLGIRTGHHRRAGGDELHVVLDLASSRVTLVEIGAEGPRLRLVLRGR